MCRAYTRALVTYCTALTGCPFKSCESQKIQSSQRFIHHGGGADVTIERLLVGNRAGWAGGTLRTPPSWNPCEKLRSALVVELALETGCL